MPGLPKNESQRAPYTKPVVSTAVNEPGGKDDAGPFEQGIRTGPGSQDYSFVGS